MIAMSKEFKVLLTTLKASLNLTLTHDLLILIKTRTTITLNTQNFFYFNTLERMYAPAVDTEQKVAFQKHSKST